MTKQELYEKYHSDVRKILENQWFDIIIRQSFPSLLKLDGEISASQMAQVSEILHWIDEEKKNLS